MNSIEFTEKLNCEFSNWEMLRSWIINSVDLEGLKVGVISFVFMSDSELLDYNVKYLNHDFYTDVITFDDSELPIINGDILISIDRIRDNAKRLKINYKEEFLRVIIHGILHLCGYKDKEDLDILQMRSKENKYLSQVDFSV